MTKRNRFGHLSSQKYSGLIFCVAVLFAGALITSAAAFSNLVMGIVGLYGAFVGGRAWSDGQALKAGVQPADVSVIKKLPLVPATPLKKDKPDEVD